MPINHHNGAPRGTALCDSLLLALTALDPSIVRHEAPSTCSFRAERHASFAFVYHYKTEPHLKIYFRAASSDRTDLPPGVLVSRRRSIGSEWAKLFPESLRLDAKEHVESVTTFLFDNSYQLAETRKGSRPHSHRPDYAPPEELLTSNTISEGSLHRITVNRYERSPAARARCIAHYGSRCIVCDFDFGLIYGAAFSGFIHVHHLTPLGTLRSPYNLDPVRDLRPVCPNCHAAIHRAEPPLTPEAVKVLLQRGQEHGA
jgi:hypothetical protein